MIPSDLRNSTTTTGRRPEVAPGTLPPELFDQDVTWIDPQGYRVNIADLSKTQTVAIMDYLLANARKLRDQWSTVVNQTYDTDVRPRRWMIERACFAAFMRRYVTLLDQERAA